MLLLDTLTLSACESLLSQRHLKRLRSILKTLLLDNADIKNVE